jgi:hypothetical protein
MHRKKDDFMKILSFFSIIALSVSVHIFAAENSSPVKENSLILQIPSYCGSLSGLRMRTAPDINADKIAVIPFGEKIDIL